MGYRSTAALVALALLLFGFLLVEREAPTSQEARERARALLSSKREDITALSITTAGETTTVSRDERGRFTLTAPVRDLADEDEASALLTQLDYARIARTLPTEDPSYGLEQPALVLRIEARAAPPLELAFGEDAVGGQQSYARRGDTGEILLLPRSLKDRKSVV